MNRLVVILVGISMTLAMGFSGTAGASTADEASVSSTIGTAQDILGNSQNIDSGTITRTNFNLKPGGTGIANVVTVTCFGGVVELYTGGVLVDQVSCGSTSGAFDQYRVVFD